ncbi:MAG TPA: DUF5947 family protein [Tepidisphaeraceae bacterium]|nr:DUF5947 family protein [Tepidisphaeraceae bacterium]
MPPSSELPLGRLRQFVRKGPAVERCELCAKELAEQHQHLIELANRRIVCACDACAVLFDGEQVRKFRRIPRRIERLADFRLSEAQWESLRLPINLAFFYRSSVAGRVVAMFPSPAGATESLLTLESWNDLAAANPVLEEMAADVEALLVDRIGENRRYFRAPIDECFKLVGIIRTHWRGLSGGTDLWQHVEAFFASLAERGVTIGAGDA